MNFSGVRCDECDRIKGEANHWHQLGIVNWNDGSQTVQLGSMSEPDSNSISSYLLRDLCGEQCFYKHIGKLLKLNPVEMEERAERER